MYLAKWFSHIVFEAASSEDLFKLDTIQELCRFQISINNTFGPLRSAIRYPQFWSLPNYLTCLAGQFYCQNLTQQDLDVRVAEIKSCDPFRKAILKCSGPSKNNLPSTNSICQTIPDSCKSKYYFDLFSFALSKNIFVKNSGPVYTTMVLPIMQLQSYMNDPNEDWVTVSATNFTPIYKDIMALKDNVKHTHIVGLNLGMKMEAFGEAMLWDSIYVLLAAVVAALICLSYSGSFFYALTIALSLVFSVGVSYFTYCIVFRIDFFPFINLLVVVLLVGIGADNTFVLKHIFDNAEMRTDPNSNKKTVDVGQALSHAARSMFITNATTAAAFYANYVSDVIVMKCFGVFAGTTMLINYLLIISWLPASLIILERYICTVVPQWIQRYNPRFNGDCCCPSKCSFIDTCRSQCRYAVEYFVEHILYVIIEKLKFLWLFSFAVVFVGSLVIVFYKPGVALPKRNPLQMFRKSHLFEWYDDHMEDLFYFSSFLNETAIDLDIVWGFKPTDVGKTLNPNDKGEDDKFNLDPTFHISMETLHGLHHFCSKLENSTLFALEGQCFIKQYFEWAEKQNCLYRPLFCCNPSNKKFNESYINNCLIEASKDLDMSAGGPIFRTNDLGKIDGFFMYAETVFNWSLIYEDLVIFQKRIDTEIASALAETAVEQLQQGWWTTAWYYLMLWLDLQNSLLHGTPSSIAISVLVALFVAVITTRTLLLSLLSIVSICGVIVITIACLVLLGWHLNIVESTIIILTAGLSFDFTLLYAAAYKISKSCTRREKVVETLNFIGLPVLLSALVTASVGVCMLPCITWGYYQVGLFMILVIIISYLSSTLFFLSLLFLFGPQQPTACNYKLLPCFEN